MRFARRLERLRAAFGLRKIASAFLCPFKSVSHLHQNSLQTSLGEFGDAVNDLAARASDGSKLKAVL
jgi:hypothetical protein